eukprot:TRINITY_DN8624_c0_g1_i1.p1 TRINITY_DN8624_c0_g1~~TRINITY_DN8624_c0_g1_i1.p1  ORF type:complete len:161 (-),score=59.19 TRINITY_DN8624_c0_g1_i1:747-1229(-)
MPPYTEEVAESLVADNECCQELTLIIASLQAELADVKHSLATCERRRAAHVVEKLRCPLENLPLLTKVFSYIGGGQHLFVAGVNRQWRGLYLRQPAPLRTATSVREALRSLPRLQLAAKSGLAMSDAHGAVVWLAARHADAATLEWAQRNGMPRILRIKG